MANATGQGTALHAHLMEACRQIIEPQPELFRGAGALDAELPVPTDATAQTRFLAMGRPQRTIPIPAIGSVHPILARASSPQDAQ